jgi:hypothetical protein
MTIKRDSGGLEVQAGRPFTSQSVAIGAASAASTAFNSQTVHVRLVATAACWISFGSPPPAAIVRDANSTFLPPNLPEYFWVVTGSQIAVIQDGAGGFLYITELANT